MASSVLSYSPWRRRGAASAPTQQDQLDPESTESSSPSQSPQIAIPASRHLSSSISSTPAFREPTRSFIHGSMRDNPVPLDSAQYARTVREDTAELASYLLSDGYSQRSSSFLQRSRPSVQDLFGSDNGGDHMTDDISHASHLSQDIPEVTEPPSPEDTLEHDVNEGPSVLSNLLKKSPPESFTGDRSKFLDALQSELRQGVASPVEHGSNIADDGDQDGEEPRPSEHTPLLERVRSVTSYSNDVDAEGQKQAPVRKWLNGLVESGHRVESQVSYTVALAANPRRWNGKAMWQHIVVAPVACLPAVAVGLLLNILDALSYGMILFPLSKPIFAHLGPAGISIFYVSTIVSQLTFSSGSIFTGAVGSELIEVVPFFHSMAQTISDRLGEEQADAIIATTIVSYAASSMMTGLVFYLMGQFKFGSVVGFIPRHILIGCIGGVGWFLVATGFEVSSRVDDFKFDIDTFLRMWEPSTLGRWLTPLALAILLFYGQAKVASKYFLPMFILGIPLIFYLFVLSLDVLDIGTLRDEGWIFEGPPAGEPWWYFYTLYNFQLVSWTAVLETIPAMLALTFFGILHVPINVPALALNCGEDNADLDKELRLHGISNFLSGCLGAIQNYLVYANTVFFMRSGGDSRLAGYMLAALTFGVMMIGPSLIGFIPVMMVGTLIFDLGFELLLEAVWEPRKKFRPAEYLTVIVIVLVMGTYDFVVGIGVGILLAFVSLVVQTSRISPVRGTYTGAVVNSTVRRNPSQHRYLQQVGKQIFIMKLTGYLFFGTIVSVEEKIRGLLDDTAFASRPIKFLVLDLWNVTGLDYSAGEAFNTISRLLDKKDVVLVLSGVDADSQLGRNLRATGLGNSGIEVMMLPYLNSALESCENELLKTLYARQEEMNSTKRTATANLDVPAAETPDLEAFGQIFNSPRRNGLNEAARDALTGADAQPPTKWQGFKEPLRLMLQIFQGLSDKNEDFWFVATKYFRRRECAAEEVLFRRGEPASGFYLLERGIIRVEYDLPQGWLMESIVAGTTCGELPFFSETDRTATATVERDCVVWVMDREAFTNLQKDEPGIATELLKISLKLTTERMSTITSYTLAVAG